MARDGRLSKLGVGSRSPAAWSAREIEFAGAGYACSALAQISPPSAAHFLKSHQLLVQKFAADRNRQKGPLRTASQRVAQPCSVVRTRDRVCRRWLRLQRARPDLPTICRSVQKFASALSAKVCGG